jgi:PAS domain S-box-containing protein
MEYDALLAENRRLQLCLDDLTSAMALPAIWIGLTPAAIVQSVLESLQNLLRLDLVYVRLNTCIGDAPADSMRLSKQGNYPPVTVLLEQLQALLSSSDSPSKRLDLGANSLLLTSTPLGSDGEIGLLVVGSIREGLRQQTERLVLGVVANLATTALLSACHVLEKTRSLTDFHDHNSAQLELASSERKLKDTIGALPGLVWTARPDGSADFVNQYFLDYVGMTIDEVMDWGWSSALHPDDLAGLIANWKKILASGSPGESLARLRGSDGQYRRFMFRVNPTIDDTGTTRWLGINFDIEDMKRAEEGMRASEVNLRLLTETIPQMLWSATPDGAIEYCNARLLEYTGLEAEAVMRDGWTNMLHPEDREPTARIWRRCVLNGDPYQVEVRTFNAESQNYRWCLTDALPLREDGGQILRWHGTCVDIHDRKIAEEARAASERKLDQIVNTIPAIAWSSDPDGYTDYLNQHYLDYVGLSLDEVKGWGWANALHPDDAPNLYAAWDQMRASGRGGTAEARLRRFDGAYRWYLFRPNPLLNDAGEVIKWYGVNTDIEDLKRTELNLRRLTETIPQMLWSASADGAIEYCNQRLVDFTGVTAHSIMTDGWRSLLHPEDVEYATRAWGNSITGGEPFHVEARLAHIAGGGYRWCLADALPLRDEDGRIIKWHGAFVDMHEWREAQGELRKTQAELAHMARVMTMGQLTASISHELNQPLAGIVTNASTCLRMLAADPPNVKGAQETARRTIRDGNRAAAVITRLRALFSKKDPTIETVDLNSATEEVIALIATELQRSTVSLNLDLAETLPYVKGDRVQLQQVIMNLVLNAMQAMDDVTDRVKDLTIVTRSDGVAHVRLAVRDVGVGLAAGDAEKLFNPFYTTKSGGMGIGLSVSRSIIDSHQGRLWAEPNEEQGATFLLTIPTETLDNAKLDDL